MLILVLKLNKNLKHFSTNIYIVF